MTIEAPEARSPWSTSTTRTTLPRRLGRVTCPYGVIVVDGHVDLDASGAPGLGAHLHEHFGGRHAVVGVAKSPFRGCSLPSRCCAAPARDPCS
jgi:hypothetical protein